MIDGTGRPAIPDATVIIEGDRIATLNPARFLGKERDMGSVEKGKMVDLVLLSADPLADINNTRRNDSVFKAGQLIDRSKLDLPVNRKVAAADVAPLLMYPLENAEE